MHEYIHTRTRTQTISGSLSLSGQASDDGVSASEPTSNRYMKFRALMRLQAYINSTDLNKFGVVFPITTEYGM